MKLYDFDIVTAALVAADRIGVGDVVLVSHVIEGLVGNGEGGRVTVVGRGHLCEFKPSGKLKLVYEMLRQSLDLADLWSPFCGFFSCQSIWLGKQ